MPAASGWITSNNPTLAAEYRSVPDRQLHRDTDVEHPIEKNMVADINASMTHAVGDAGCPIEGVVTLEQAINQMVASKESANRRPAYVKCLRSYLSSFARGMEELPISSISHQHLFEWVSKGGAASSRQQRLRLLGVLFSHAVRVGTIEKDPSKQIERISVDQKVPAILTPKQVRRMLSYVKRRIPHRLPQVVLGVYAGIRPTELSRLYWRDVDLGRGIVRVDAAASKTRHRRIVQLEPKAVAWLRVCARILKNSASFQFRPIGSSPSTDRWKRSIRYGCGIEWSADLLRHTAASFLIAKHQSAERVARILGNSPRVLLDKYYEIVDPSDCRRFWKCAFRP